MKKSILKILMAGVLLAGTAMSASAAPDVFIVSNGTSYTLTINPDSGQTATAYKWANTSGATLATTQTNSPASTATGTAATVDTFLTSYQIGTGCWSDYDTVIVYFLPSIKVDVAAQNTVVCDNEDADTLTATTNFSSLTFTVMGSVSIDYTDFTWSPMAGATVAGAKNYQLAVTQSGSYTATTMYDIATLPGTVNSLAVTGSKVDGEYSNATAVSVTVNTAPGTPTVTIQ